MNIKLINRHTGADPEFTNSRIADFLHEHLGQYGDPVKHILKAIAYVFEPHRGGNILLAVEEREITGAVVLNQTGMSGYIPENILVYIAVRADQRGKGVGRRLMEKAKEVSDGHIALHVAPDNPAVRLYKKVGFEKKYVEMRFASPES